MAKLWLATGWIDGNNNVQILSYTLSLEFIPAMCGQVPSN